MVSNRRDPDVGLPGTPSDEFTYSQHRPPKPLGFKVEVSGDGQHVQFSIRDALFPQVRSLLSEYRVYFSPISLLGNAEDIKFPTQAATVFASGKMVGSTPPGNHGELLEFESATVLAAERGWYFAVSVNFVGVESDPTPPCPAPANGGSGGIADSVVPGDVTAAQISLFGEYVDSVPYVRVIASALCPRPLGSFDGYQLYIKGYRDLGYTSVVEDGFAKRGTQEAGELLTVSFLMEPDMPPFYDVGTVSVTQGSSSVVGVGTNWNLNWAQERSLAFYAYHRSTGDLHATNGSDILTYVDGDHFGAAYVGHTITFNATTFPISANPTPTTLQIPAPFGGATGTYSWISPIFSPTLYGHNSPIDSVSDPEHLDLTTVASWGTQGGLDYVIYPNNTQGWGLTTRPTQHKVTFYFVALSKAGTRNSDVTSSPSVTFPFGLSAALSKPANPYDVTALVQGNSPMSSQGAAITLTWKVVDSALGRYDSTLRHFNIYRSRQGTAGFPLDPAAARPLTPYASVQYDRAMSNLGLYTWTDKAFNTDPAPLPPVPPEDPTAWDFNPADLGQYTYWVTAINVEGTENKTAYWGTATAAGAVLSQTGGDVFTADFVGQTIYLGTSPFTIESFDAITGDLTLDSAPTAGTYDYKVASVTGRVTLVGLSGSEGDPTLAGDDYLNRLFNSQFISSTTVVDVDEPVETDHNIGYNATVMASDGQPTFRFYFTDEAYNTGGGGGGGVAGRQNNQAAGAPPTLYSGGSPFVGTAGALPPAPNSAYDDNWSVWQYSISPGMSKPVFKSAVAGTTATTGEVVLKPQLNGAGDFSTIAQLIQKRKFPPGMPFVLSAMLKSAAGAGGGNVLMQVVRYDARDFSNAAYKLGVAGATPGPALGLERDSGVGGVINCTALEPDYGEGRPAVRGNLPVGDPATRSGVSANNGSPTITSAGTDFTEDWLGCIATVKQGANTLVAEIIEVTGTVNPDAQTTIKLAANWTFANTSAATLDVQILSTHYIVKIGVNDVWDQDVYVRAPMLNSGLRGAPYNSVMVKDDAPGGDDAPPDGNPGPGPQPACVPAGTLVETYDGQRAIELIRPGDVILSVSSPQSPGRRKFKKSQVVKLNEARTTRLYRITTTSRSIVCSPTHRFRLMNRQKYIEAQKIKVGMLLVGSSAGVVTTEVVSIKEEQTYPDSIGVYSLSVESPHNYIAGGFLCHNKPPYVEQN